MGWKVPLLGEGLVRTAAELDPRPPSTEEELEGAVPGRAVIAERHLEDRIASDLERMRRGAIGAANTLYNEARKRDSSYTLDDARARVGHARETARKRQEGPR